MHPLHRLPNKIASLLVLMTLTGCGRRSTHTTKISGAKPRRIVASTSTPRPLMRKLPALAGVVLAAPWPRRPERALRRLDSRDLRSYCKSLRPR